MTFRSIGLGLAFAVMVLSAPAVAYDVVYPALQEPKHRAVFHNDRIDVYDVRLVPGERSFFHRHTNDQLGIVMRSGTSMNEVQGLPAAEISTEQGAISYVPHSQTGGLVHRVQASVEGGNPAFWVIGVEFAKPAGATTERKTAAAGQPELTFPQGRIERIGIAAKERRELSGHLLVALADGALMMPKNECWSIKEGDVRWIGDAPVSVRNDGGGGAIPFAMLTLKD